MGFSIAITVCRVGICWRFDTALRWAPGPTISGFIVYSSWPNYEIRDNLTHSGVGHFIWISGVFAGLPLLSWADATDKKAQTTSVRLSLCHIFTFRYPAFYTLRALFIARLILFAETVLLMYLRPGGSVFAAIGRRAASIYSSPPDIVSTLNYAAICRYSIWNAE